MLCLHKRILAGGDGVIMQEQNAEQVKMARQSKFLMMFPFDEKIQN